MSPAGDESGSSAWITGRSGDRESFSLKCSGRTRQRGRLPATTRARLWMIRDRRGGQEDRNDGSDAEAGREALTLGVARHRPSSRRRPGRRPIPSRSRPRRTLAPSWRGPSYSQRRRGLRRFRLLLERYAATGTQPSKRRIGESERSRRCWRVGWHVDWRETSGQSLQILAGIVLPLQRIMTIYLALAREHGTVWGCECRFRSPSKLQRFACGACPPARSCLWRVAASRPTRAAAQRSRWNRWVS